MSGVPRSDGSSTPIQVAGCPGSRFVKFQDMADRAFGEMFNGQNVAQPVKEDFNRNVDRSTPGQLTTFGGTTDFTTTSPIGFKSMSSTGAVSYNALPGAAATADMTVHAPGAKPGPASVSIGAGAVSAEVTDSSVSVHVGPQTAVPEIKGGANVAADKSAVSEAASTLAGAAGSFFVKPPSNPTPPPPPPQCQTGGTCK
jgi:hypothetical protein